MCVYSILPNGLFLCIIYFYLNLVSKSLGTWINNLIASSLQTIEGVQQHCINIWIHTLTNSCSTTLQSPLLCNVSYKAPVENLKRYKISWWSLTNSRYMSQCVLCRSVVSLVIGFVERDIHLADTSVLTCIGGRSHHRSCFPCSVDGTDPGRPVTHSLICKLTIHLVCHLFISFFTSHLVVFLSFLVLLSLSLFDYMSVISVEALGDRANVRLPVHPNLSENPFTLF